MIFGKMLGRTLIPGVWFSMLVPWDVTIADGERKPIEEVLAEFWDERAGILNWLIEGALVYLADGLKVPHAIADATAEYREENYTATEATLIAYKNLTTC
jgi:phage/plasmid-associated DNA primase